MMRIRPSGLRHRVKVDSGIGLPNAHSKCVGVIEIVGAQKYEWIIGECFIAMGSVYPSLSM
jgi:hypothetical protein